MKKILSILLIMLVILEGCGNPTTYTSSRNLIIKSEKTIPYEVENYSHGNLLSAIKITGISVKDDENYVTKNRDAEITITYEVLYTDFMKQDVFAIDIVDKNGNYPMVQDGRTYGDNSKKLESKDIYLGFNTKQAHTRDSITFPVKDIEKGEYSLIVKGRE